MSNKQNNHLSKSNFFIPQINNGLGTPTTSDPDLSSSIHSSHNNRKTLEFFNKSSAVNYMIDEVLTELGNESEIYNASILVFPIHTCKIFLLLTLLHVSRF